MATNITSTLIYMVLYLGQSPSLLYIFTFEIYAISVDRLNIMRNSPLRDDVAPFF